MSTLADRLKIAIKEAGINKTAIWKACGISSGAVSQWFNGTIQQLEGKNLIAAARVLKVNPDWLATGKGDRGDNHYVIEGSFSRVTDGNAVKIERDPIEEDLALLDPLIAAKLRNQLDGIKIEIKIAAQAAKKQRMESDKLDRDQARADKPGVDPPLDSRRTA